MSAVEELAARLERALSHRPDTPDADKRVMLTFAGDEARRLIEAIAELEAALDSAVARNLVAVRENSALRKRCTEMKAALDECAEWFTDRADISDDHNEDGSPRPNKEMQMLTTIRFGLGELP